VYHGAALGLQQYRLRIHRHTGRAKDGRGLVPVSPVPRCIEGASLAGVASRFKVGTYDQCSLVQRVDGDGLQLTEISIPRAIEFSFNFRDPPQVALSLLSIIEIEKRDVKTLGIELALISNPVECVDLQ